MLENNVINFLFLLK